MLAALLFALQQPKLQEQITVERVLVDARVNHSNGSPVPSPGRRLVVLYQTDFARNDARVRGQMKLLQMDEWLDWIEPEDRVAVLSFDSHLKFRLDFTNNKHDIANA